MAAEGGAFKQILCILRDPAPPDAEVNCNHNCTARISAESRRILEVEVTQPQEAPKGFAMGWRELMPWGGGKKAPPGKAEVTIMSGVYDQCARWPRDASHATSPLCVI